MGVDHGRSPVQSAGPGHGGPAKENEPLAVVEIVPVMGIVIEAAVEVFSALDEIDRHVVAGGGVDIGGDGRPGVPDAAFWID